MLRIMQRPAERQPSPDPANFAGLLASLSAARGEPSQPWIGDLEDDVATLSYEQALKAHARSRPAAGDRPPLPAVDRESVSHAGASASDRAAETGSAVAADAWRAAVSASAREKLEQSRKRSSITVRMSREECAQLQQRAAEAGLTVSAYLRFCTFEVESLRAQVKEALTELRTARGEAQVANPWWRRILGGNTRESCAKPSALPFAH